jgi:hypothetical protein
VKKTRPANPADQGLEGFAEAAPGRPMHCDRVVLACSDLCRIDHCSCGHLHLSIGPVTLRVDANVLAHLCATLGEARRQLLLQGATPFSH